VELDPSPPDLLFGDVQLDAGSGQADTRSLPLTIRNAGGDPLRITAIARAPGTSLEYTFQPASISPIDAGQQAVLNVAFRPTNTGDESGMLWIDTNDPDISLDGQTGRFAVNLQARGTDPFIFVSPAAAHNFGVTSIAEHKSLDVTIRNASSFPLQLTNIRLTAGSSVYYSLSDLPPLPMTIPDSLVEVHFTVHYDPAQVGQHTGAVEILSSDIGNPVVTIALSGDCQGCPAGTADCNPGVPGCETNINTDDSNCGGCGIVCQDVNGTNTCVNGVCQPVCSPLWGDCDSSRPNGCETPTNSLSNCGSCGQACNLPHATETCATGTCQVQACDAGYSDCTGAPGCETHTYQDVNNCGACGNTCTNAHGTTQCVANVCSPSCDGLWGNCDGDPDDGCETPTNTLINCGTCGTGCALNNAAESCASGTCLVTACDSGWCNQDTLHPNGCEFDLDTNPACSGYTDLGTVSGDEGGDHLTYTAHHERWFRMRVAETYADPLTCLYLSATIILDVPAGTNYDLYVYCDNCSSSAGSSTASGATDEQVNIRWDEGCIWPGIPDGGDDGRYVYIKVQFADANTCADWILHVYGNTAVSNNTCSTP
jgi:hypothetical protein